MNKNFNEWYIEKQIPIQDGQLEKRWGSITKFAEKIESDDIVNLVKFFYNLDVDDEFITTFAEVFIEDDHSFTRKNKFELSLLSGATLLHIAEENQDYCYFVELAVLAASFGRVPQLRDILIGIEKEFSNDTFLIRENNSNIIQEIQQPPIESLLKGLEEEDYSHLSNYIKTINVSFKELNKIFNKISKSQEIYFEDSQLLWWLTSGWSRVLNCPYKKIDKKSACLYIGIEAAELVNVFPGPYSIKGVLNKMLEECTGKNVDLKFSDVIYASLDKWNTKYDSSELLELLPITSALIRSKNTSSEDEWISKYSKDLCLSVDDIKTKSPLEFAMQIYLEVLVQRCYSILNS